MLKLTLAAGALLGFAFTALPSTAAETVVFDAGNVAFAYNDGYWDHDHHWHKWHNVKESHAFRKEHQDAYHAWKHNRDKDLGWHEEHH